MDLSTLRQDWADWVPHFQAHFPHAQIPDILPQGALADDMLASIAAAHDLTPQEVMEIIEDVATLAYSLGASSQAA